MGVYSPLVSKKKKYNTNSSSSSRVNRQRNNNVRETKTKKSSSGNVAGGFVFVCGSGNSNSVQGGKNANNMASLMGKLPILAMPEIGPIGQKKTVEELKTVSVSNEFSSTLPVISQAKGKEVDIQSGVSSPSTSKHQQNENMSSISAMSKSLNQSPSPDKANKHLEREDRDNSSRQHQNQIVSPVSIKSTSNVSIMNNHQQRKKSSPKRNSQEPKMKWEHGLRHDGEGSVVSGAGGGGKRDREMNIELNRMAAFAQESSAEAMEKVRIMKQSEWAEEDRKSHELKLQKEEEARKKAEIVLKKKKEKNKEAMEALWEEERAKQVEEHLNKLAQEASVSDLTPAEHAQRSRAARIALHTIPKSNPAYPKKKENMTPSNEAAEKNDMFDGYIGSHAIQMRNKSKNPPEKEKRTREETKKMASEMKLITKSKERELDDFLKDMAREVTGTTRGLETRLLHPSETATGRGAALTPRSTVSQLSQHSTIRNHNHIQGHKSHQPITNKFVSPTKFMLTQTDGSPVSNGQIKSKIVKSKDDFMKQTTKHFPDVDAYHRRLREGDEKEKPVYFSEGVQEGGMVTVVNGKVVTLLSQEDGGTYYSGQDDYENDDSSRVSGVSVGSKFGNKSRNGPDGIHNSAFDDYDDISYASSMDEPKEEWEARMLSQWVARAERDRAQMQEERQGRRITIIRKGKEGLEQIEDDETDNKKKQRRPSGASGNGDDSSIGTAGSSSSSKRKGRKSLEEKAASIIDIQSPKKNEYEAYVGRKVLKSFELYGKFRGVVTSFIPAQGTDANQWTVLYEDDDEEVLLFHELTPLLVPLRSDNSVGLEGSGSSVNSEKSSEGTKGINGNKSVSAKSKQYDDQMEEHSSQMISENNQISTDDEAAKYSEKTGNELKSEVKSDVKPQEVSTISATSLSIVESKNYVGSKVEKEFEDYGLFSGTVTAYSPAGSTADVDMYTVVYEDDDEEDLTLQELLAILVEVKHKKENILDKSEGSDKTNQLLEHSIDNKSSVLENSTEYEDDFPDEYENDYEDDENSARLTETEEALRLKKDIEEKEALRLKKEAEEKEALRLKKEADEKEALRLKKEAEEKEALRLKKDAEEKEVLRLKKEAEEKEVLRLKKEAEEKEALRFKKEAEEKEALRLKTEAEEKEVLRLKKEAEEKEALRLKKEAEEKEVLRLKKDAEEKEVLRLKKEAEEKEALRLKKEVEEKEALRLKKEVEEKEVLRLKKEAEEKEALRLKKEAEEKEVLRLKKEAEEKEALRLKTEAEEKEIARLENSAEYEDDFADDYEDDYENDESSVENDVKNHLKKEAEAKEEFRLKAEAEEKEALRLKKEVEEKEALRLKKEVEEKEALRLKKEVEEKEALRLKKEVEEKEALRLKKEAEEKEALRLKKEAEEKEALRLKKDAEEKEVLRLKKEAEEKESPQQINIKTTESLEADKEEDYSEDEFEEEDSIKGQETGDY